MQAAAELGVVFQRFHVDAELRLEARPGRLPLAAAAKLVGLSTRTLQRTLADLGTSFQHEVNCAQVTHAQKLLQRAKVEVAEAHAAANAPFPPPRTAMRISASPPSPA